VILQALIERAPDIVALVDRDRPDPRRVYQRGWRLDGAVIDARRLRYDFAPRALTV
jgi:hypothetical protein